MFKCENRKEYNRKHEIIQISGVIEKENIFQQHKFLWFHLLITEISQLQKFPHGKHDESF